MASALPLFRTIGHQLLIVALVILSLPIVRQLEQGNVPLEESLKLFQEGTKLVQGCTKQLDKAELEVVKLMKGPDGEPVEQEFVRDE